MTTTYIITLIFVFCMIAWKFFKVRILKFISRWNWGRKVIKSLYLETLYKREVNKVKTLKKAIKIAKARHAAEGLKMYVILLDNGNYWYGTMREWNIYQKDNHVRKLWPPKDAVWQTSNNGRSAW